jgi:Na+/melibiose symporter-like transporter
MVGAVGLSLEWVAFDPELPVTEAAKQTMRCLVGGVPVIGFGLGMLAMLRFRLSERLHARIRLEIEARGARVGAG